LQVRVWNDTHSSIGRLASYASGTHWLFAYGITLKNSLFSCHSFCEKEEYSVLIVLALILLCY